LWSGTLRRTVPASIQVEYLFVDSSLKEHSAFASFYQTENEMKIFGNMSCPDSELFQMTLGLSQYSDDTNQIAVSAKVLYPDVWLDALLNLDDDDMGGYTFNGHLNAPGLYYLTMTRPYYLKHR
jgi:hypothetical protein